MNGRVVSSLAACVVVAAMGAAGYAAATPVVGVKQQGDGVLLTMQPGVMQLQVWSDGVIRVTYAPGATLPALKSLSVVGKPAGVKWTMKETPEAVVLETGAVRATVTKKTGAVGFADLTGKVILQETEGGKEIGGAGAGGAGGTGEEHGRDAHATQSFVLAADEGIYGLGQHQQGIWNYRGHTVHLQQRNMEVGIPVLLSSKGYGVLWDNPAVTDIAVGRDAPQGGGADVVRWTSEVGGVIDYYFMYGANAPATAPNGDGVIGDYRALTGAAPMMPKWLWGFFQCKERYRTQAEILNIAKTYRDMKVPIDGIIQDWRYWPEASDTWGSHQFDAARYPDPAAMVKQLHEMNYHILISVWPKFDLGSANIEELDKAGAMYPTVIPYVFPPGKGKWYDPFSAAGREIYWKQVSKQLFSIGIDGWWLDAPEPELSGKWGEFRTYSTGMGTGASVFNAYPLMHSTGIYQGERAQEAGTADEKRVVILTRSAYAGQQRNSAITWSGDIGSTWQVLARQIPAGLNFSASGIPYWNTDIGGFGGAMNPNNAGYREIFTRWFQFGAFCPMFRVHGSAPNGGTGPGKEIWRFDEKTQAIWRTYVGLRYRLIPYIYSTSWQVTSNGGTMMRPLVMDFANDPEVLNIGNQFLFGPAIMVNPVTAAGVTTRDVYLPEGGDGGGWYDFWTGKKEAGGKHVDAAAPVETMPLYVRAGSILPMGPVVQYAEEKPEAPLEVRIYRGADGTFTIYEDEGDSYRYEKGAYATIPLTWNEAAGTLTIGARKGEFAGMVKEREFNVVFVGEGHGSGVAETEKADQNVRYTGTAVTVKAGG